MVGGLVGEKARGGGRFSLVFWDLVGEERAGQRKFDRGVI